MPYRASVPQREGSVTSWCVRVCVYVRACATYAVSVCVGARLIEACCRIRHKYCFT